MIDTHYERLGLEPDASPQQIKHAYRTLARLAHPDVAGNEPGRRVDQMAELNEAFRVLRDPERRRRYDAQLRGEPLPAESGAGPSSSPDRPAWIADEGPEPMVFTALPKVFVVGLIGAVMVAFFVVSLFVFQGGDAAENDDPVDGLVGVGSCVAVSGVGGQVGETSCNGFYDGTVMALVGFDRDCPSGTIEFKSQSVSTRVCVAPRTG